MKVLLTSTDNPFTTHVGGKHIHLLLLERGLKELGIEVTTLYYDLKSPREFIKRSMLQLLSERKRYEIKLSQMMNYLRRHLQGKESDLVHSHDVLSIIAMNSMPQKKVLTLHGYFARENLEFMKDQKNRQTLYPYLLQLEKDAMRMADYVITVDQRLKEYIISEFSYPAGKIRVMHNAIDADRFEPVEDKEKQELRNKIGFTTQNLIVIVPRRLVEKNGVIYAVRAMKHMKNRDLRMIIAGDGPERAKIAEEAKRDNRISLAGTVPHGIIDPYYKMADIILIPSITSHGIQEATSLSMLEGMACGKVVICSDIGGMHEVIQNMKNGILVEEKKPEVIANALENIIENSELRAEMGSEAREYVLQNHSFMVHAQKVAQVYRNVLGE